MRIPRTFRLLRLTRLPSRPLALGGTHQLGGLRRRVLQSSRRRLAKHQLGDFLDLLPVLALRWPASFAPAHQEVPGRISAANAA